MAEVKRDSKMFRNMEQKMRASGVPEETIRAYMYHDPAKSFKKFATIAGGIALGAPLIAGAVGAGGAAAGAGAAANAGAGAGAAKAAGSGGAMDWLKGKLGGVSGGDWLNALGTGVGGYLDYQGSQQSREESMRQFAEMMKQRQAEAATASGQFDRNLANSQGQFDRTQDATEGQIAVRAETAINKAPIADKAQALLMSRMGSAPPAFQPRDFTSSLSNIRGQSTGGPAASLNADRAAAAAYQPGQGGVKTDALKLLRDRMMSSIQPPTTPTVAARPTQPAPPVLPNERVPTESSTDLLRRRMAPRFGASRPAYT